MPLLCIYWRSEPLFDHMPVAKRMNIDDSVRERPDSMPRPLSRGLQEVEIGKNVLSRYSRVGHALRKGYKFMHQLPFSLLGRIGDLFSRKAVDRQSFILNLGAFPGTALLVELALRVLKVDSADAQYGMQGGLKTRHFAICD